MDFRRYRTCNLVSLEHCEGKGMTIEPAFDNCCPGCGDVRTQSFYRIQEQPVFVGITYDDAYQARLAPVGDIDLHYCGRCGLVFNAAFDVSKLDYRPGYEVSLVHSPLFRRFLDSIVDRLAASRDLKGKTIVEIGCGAGHFLRLACQRLGCNGVGIDPACPVEGVEHLGSSTIRWIRDHYGERYANLHHDVVCCLDAFEQIPQPAVFLKSLRRILARRKDVLVYFQSPDRDHVFDQGIGWSVYYEQCSHFDVETIRGLFEQCGFEVVGAARNEINPQYLQIEAQPASSDVQVERVPPEAIQSKLPAALLGYAGSQRARVAWWDAKLIAIATMGQRAVLWGSGGKGVNFLNTVPAAHTIERIIDINPARQGRHMPRSGQQIVSPSCLVNDKPDLIILSNCLWRPEICEELSSMGVDCEVVDA